MTIDRRETGVEPRHHPMTSLSGKLGRSVRIFALGATLCSAWLPRAGAAVSAAATAKARPDWNGVWVLAGGPMDTQDGTFLGTPGRGGDKDDATSSQPDLKGDYLSKFQALQHDEANGKRDNDTGAACIPQGMPRFWHGPYAFEILQTQGQINIYQEWNEQTRRIYLDGRKPNPDADPSYNGYSLGHWQGQELIIGTTQLREDSGLGAGATHSDQIAISESIRPIGSDMILVRMTVTDPKALKAPWVSTYKLHRKHGMEIQEYNCFENNRDQ